MKTIQVVAVISILIASVYQSSYAGGGDSKIATGKQTKSSSGRNTQVVDRGAEYFNSGSMHLDNEEYSAAINDFNEVIRINPDNAACFFRRAEAYQRSNQKSKAIADYKQALQLKPDYKAAEKALAKIMEDPGFELKQNNKTTTNNIENPNTEPKIIDPIVDVGRDVQELNKAIIKSQVEEAKNWIELEMYISEKGVEDKDDVGKKDKVFDIDSRVNNFLQNPDKKVLLIQGDSGTGKTLYSQYLITQALKNKNAVIPIYINLPSLKDPVLKLMAETLHNKTNLIDIEVQRLKSSKQEFILVLDGYDEITQMQNLYTTNKLDEWNCKVIITCRTQYLSNESTYYKHFAPLVGTKVHLDKYQEIVLVPFNNSQIDEYLTRYVAKHEVDWQDWRKYREYIDKIPGLKELVETPFALSMVVEVLPRVVMKRAKDTIEDAEKNKMMSIDLYDEFTDWWFDTQETKLTTISSIKSVRNVKLEFKKFTKSLASQMMAKGITVVTYDSEKDNEWTKFFGESDDRINTIRRGAPLKTTRVNGGAQYSFLHKSLLEYFAAKAGQDYVINNFQNVE